METEKPPSVNGHWQSVGSGWVLTIQDSSTYSWYDITTLSCLPQRTNADIQELNLSFRGDTLVLQKGVIPYLFVRTEELPGLCKNTLSEAQKADPLYNFEVFSETVRTHYAFMELNEVNWPAIYQAQKEKLRQNPTPLMLYQAIDSCFHALRDNHAYLEADEALYPLLDSLAELQPAASDSLPELGDFQIANRVSKHHLMEDMTTDSWLIQWGKLTDSIGYIQLKAMWLYATLDIPEQLIEEKGYVDAYVETFHRLYEGNYIGLEVAGVARIMQRLMSDLGDMQAIVIDIRFNGGGQDAVSFEILRHFNPEALTVATQKLYTADGFTPTANICLGTSKNAFSRPVYVLCSQQTGSAAEAFALATLAMDNVKRIGAPTSGAMSTALEKKLPNGWAFAISNEVYMDLKGQSYENQGIPADYPLPYPADRQTFFHAVANNLAADKESILQAIKALQPQKLSD